MGFLGFFNKKEKKVMETERVLFENLSSWIGDKNFQIKKDNSIFLELMKSNLSDLIDNLKKCISNLKNLNWEKIKEKERIKLIVKENLEIYIVRLKKVVNDLENLESSDKMKQKLKMVFSDFDKRAGLNYQKASILIGKELTEVNESVRNFFREINKIQNENTELFRNLEVVSNVEEKLEKFRESERIIKEIDSEINSFGEKINDLKGEIKNSELSIEGIKKSEIYLEELKNKEKLSELRKIFQLKLNSLKSATDFKELTRVWHKNNVEMEIIKKYNNDFREIFKREDGEIFKKLINSLDNKELLAAELNNLRVLKTDIGKIKFGKNLTEDMERKIENLRDEILRMNSQELIERKRISKLKLTNNNFVEDIRKDLIKIDVTLTI